MKPVLVFITLLFLSRPSLAGETWVWTRRDLKAIAAIEKRVTERDGRHTVETDRWNVETNVSARFTAELALFMNKLSVSFDGLIQGLHDGKKIERKPTAVVFDEKSEYQKMFPGGSRGYYRYNFSGNTFDELHVYSYIDREKERNFKFFYHPILVHEGTHLLLRTYLGKTAIPAWLDEGVATYFQFWNLAAPGKHNLKTRYSRSIYRDVLRKEFLAKRPTLEELFGIETWNPDNMGPIANRHYALGESFVDFLLSSPAGQKLFKRIFDRLQSKEELFSAKEIAQLDRAWHAHIQKTTGL